MQTPILDDLIPKPRTPEQLRILKEELDEQQLRDKKIKPPLVTN